MEEKLNQFGDMPVSEFKKNGYQLIDWIAEYLENIESSPVFSDINPGDVKSKINSAPNAAGETMDAILSDIDKIIMPGMTHWNHPNFMAYFNSTASGPGILGELLSGALNINGMLWKSCPASTELEEITTDWLRQLLNLPENFWGIIYDTASVSTMHALAAAREQFVQNNFSKAGNPIDGYLHKLTIYASEHAHSSISKGAILIGIERKNVKSIPVDKNFSLIPEELSKQIAADKACGLHPFCVVSTVGSTSTTSIDPVEQIAEIASAEKVWHHVDAAHAGIAAMIPKYRKLLNGSELADSIVVNPHKWMFTPIDLSVLFTTKKELLKKAFSISSEYLKSDEDDEVDNLMDYGIQLGRRFRSLKFWFVMRYFGRDGLTERIREHIRLGQLFAKWIDQSDLFERLAPTPLSTVCFRAMPKSLSEDQLNELNGKLMNAINSSGKLFLSHTKLNGKFTIRLVISGLRTEEKHVKAAWELIQTKMQELR